MTIRFAVHCLAALTAVWLFAIPFTARAASQSVVFAFTGTQTGYQPYGPVTWLDGKSYGETADGGSEGLGVIYSVTGHGKETILHTFLGGNDGAHPSGGLLNVGGTLFGVTVGGGGTGCGKMGCGTVFSIAPNGTYAVLYAFKGGSDGLHPYSAMIDVAGTLYGTATGGGAACSCGVVFSITLAGAENVVYRFLGGSDGQYPQELSYQGGTLYGVTSEGGGSGTMPGYGTVFMVTPTGVETVLHRFGNRGRGALPVGAPILLGNALYGTTLEGGAGSGNGYGTIYKLTSTGGYKILHAFSGADGSYVGASLTLHHTILYGTTDFGGSEDAGTVFSITRRGVFSVVYEFTGLSDGYSPEAKLIVGAGALYGTTIYGGDFSHNCKDHGCGTVFTITP